MTRISIAYAGLVPVMRLAERCGLSRLVTEQVKLPGRKNGAGAAAGAKVTSVVGGMVAGADSIDDLDVLRHGAMPAVFAGLRAPSTLGTFLRTFTHGHALQLHAVHRRFLAHLAAHTPLLPGADKVAFIDVDSTHKRVYGRAKQGAEYGRFKGARTLHPLLATICAPTTRPVIAAVRMRRGKAADAEVLRNSLPKPWPPPGRRAAPACACCGRIRSSTTQVWWPPAADPAPASRSPPV